jgi:cobalt-zinc-cadmium efflux system protein
MRNVLAGRLRLAFLLTIAILGVEVVSGIAAHSLALLADAGHILTDVAALGLAWFAAVQASRPADARNTFGYHRVGILAALANAVTLVLIVAFVVVEAVRRLQEPAAVTPWIMALGASLAVGANLLIAGLLRPHSHEDLNARAAILHVLGDVAASAGVIVGALLIAVTGRNQIDPAISLAIAVLIAVGAWRILRESGAILMEGSPRGLDVVELVAEITAQPGVTGVHDLHVWSLDSSRRALSAHLGVETTDLRACEGLLEQVNAVLFERFAIAHSTFQLECADCTPQPDLYCSVDAQVTPTAAQRR